MNPIDATIEIIRRTIIGRTTLLVAETLPIGVYDISVK